MTDPVTNPGGTGTSTQLEDAGPSRLPETGCRTCPVGQDPDAVGGLFASRSVAVHLLRGAIGALLMAAALVLASTSALSLLLALPAVLAWRGCPTCWTLGLIETRRRARSGLA